MPTIPREHPEPPPPEPPRKARLIAESFGTDAEGHDRARPGYPDALVARIVAGSPGPGVLDVGCGSGLRNLGPGRPEVRHGHRRPVLALGRPGRRRREGGPGTAPRRAAGDLRPCVRAARRGGQAVRRRPLDIYQAAYAKFAGKIRETGQFRQPGQWRSGWEQSYTRDQWLALLPATGGLTRLTPGQLASILGEADAAIGRPGRSLHDALHHPGGHRGTRQRLMT